MSKSKTNSINLYPVDGDNEKSGSEDEDNGPDGEDMLALSQALAATQGVWKEGGVHRDNLIAKVIGSMAKFVSYEEEHTNNPYGECIISKKFTALPQAAVTAFELRRYVLKSVSCGRVCC